MVIGRRYGFEAGTLAVAILAFSILAELGAAPAMAAPPTWSVRFNGSSQDVPADPPSRRQGGYMFGGWLGRNAMAVDALGNVYIAGTATVDPVNGEDFLVQKFDAAGTLLWYRTLDGGSQFGDTATCLAISADAVYVTGESCKTGGSPCNSDFLTVKYDAGSGAQLWVKLADGPFLDRDLGPCVAVDAAGTPFVAGTTRNGNSVNLSDFLTIKYNPTTGAESWRNTATTSGNGTGDSLDFFDALGVGADGHVVVTGRGDPTLNGLRGLLTVKYDTSNGAPIWTHTATWAQDVYPHAIVLDATSNPIVVGETDRFGDPKFFALKYQAANGALGWLRNVNYAPGGGPGGGDDGAHDVAVDGPGNVYVTGRSRVDGAGGYDFHTVKYRALDGFEQWSHSFGTGLADDDYVPTAIALNAANDRVFVTGYHESPSGTRDFFTERLNAADGNLNPLQRSADALPYDLAVDVAVDSAGNVIVAGGSASDTERDLMVLKYDSLLLEVWRAADPDRETHEVLGTFSSPELGRKKIAIDSLGNTVMVGSTTVTPGSTVNRFLVQKYGPGGNLLWSRPIDGATGGDSGVAVVLGGTSDIYVTGFSNGAIGVGYDILTLRLNSTNGNTVWTHRYNAPANNSDVPLSMALGTDRVFVAGFSQGAVRQNLIVLGYPLGDGTSPWVAGLDFPGGSAAYAVAVSCMDNFFSQCLEGVYIAGVAINAGSTTSGNEFLTALFDAGTGVLVTGLTQGSNAIGYAIAAFGNPSTVVATGRLGNDWMTTAFQGSTQIPLWTVSKDFDGHADQALDVAFDSTGNPFVTGFATQNPDLNKQAATIKYNAANGAELQASRFGVVEYDVTAYGVATDFAGNIYLGGSRRERLSGKNDLMVLTYTNDLVLGGGGFVDSLGSDDQGSALAVERVSGDAVVAGTAYANLSPGDLLLAKFRAYEKGRFFTMTPCRLYDSRNDPAGPLAGGQTRVISALGFAGNCSWLTPAVKSLAINVTAVDATAGGHFQLYPGNLATPNTSVVNFPAGRTRANNAILNLATNAAGTFAIRSGLPDGQTAHVIVDVVGYFD